MNIFNNTDPRVLRKPSVHLMLLLFAVGAFLIYLLIRPGQINFKEIPQLLILVFFQIEVFILLGSLIFRKLRSATTRREMTRIILSRFGLFMIACFIAAFIIALIYIPVSAFFRGTVITGLYSDFFHNQFGNWVKSTLTGLSIGAVIFIFFQWQDALKREQKLREEKLVFQHETLKSQVNPHFLFNSLNTISSLIQTQPETAERFIRNLSSVYRYILENGHKDTVPLQSEIDFISGYFDLHRIRDEEKILLAIDIPGADRFRILPVSLQILLENAIKHNIATRDNPLKINIFIEGETIVVSNNLQKKASQLQSTKTGLSNLAERVKLMSGKELIIKETIDRFVVKLPLLK